MKRLLLVATLSLSASAFAQMCEVEMVDTRTNNVIRTFRSYDDNYGCKESMKQCSKEIRFRNLPRAVRCERVVMDRYPTPIPAPTPRPTDPRPFPGSGDARRMLRNGDSAILNGRYVTVVGMSFSGQYAVRSNDGWNTVTNNVRRESLYVTQGCALNLCTSDSVINVSTARYVEVVGLSYNEDFAVRSKDGWNTISTGIERRNLAETSGCISSRYAQLCVGNTVINNYNRYSTVVGIQMNGKVVLKSNDGWNTLSTNVDPLTLTITR